MVLFMLFTLRQPSEKKMNKWRGEITGKLGDKSSQSGQAKEHGPFVPLFRSVTGWQHPAMTKMETSTRAVTLNCTRSHTHPQPFAADQHKRLIKTT